MCACYYLLNKEDELLNLSSKGEEELLDYIEENLSESEDLVDIDKMWDALHFVFTGSECGIDLENPLSIAVAGEIELEISDGLVALVSKEKIPQVVKALSEFDMPKALANFSMQKCKEAEIYPNIWDYEEELEEIREELQDAYNELLAFYQKAEEQGKSVLITIY
ncbi:YfbM family protein [Ornithobacterium rhinotracheale]|nr:YfbM family protein [Ornithobacterium rhinotracheale]MCK0195082.1 YfbM family protein [Ornithobacterium rhinotracheale]UOH62670.1 YfbM family protein [Ornithobacterium rhinotracheale]UOH65123.1 YfbM family protein [Ornithobacterium rhinotracheale]